MHIVKISDVGDGGVNIFLATLLELIQDLRIFFTDTKEGEYSLERGQDGVASIAKDFKNFTEGLFVLEHRSITLVKPLENCSILHVVSESTYFRKFIKKMGEFVNPTTSKSSASVFEGNSAVASQFPNQHIFKCSGCF